MSSLDDIRASYISNWYRPRQLCQVCGKEMYRCRKDKKTCSTACRKRLSRGVGVPSRDEVSHLSNLRSEIKKCDKPFGADRGQGVTLSGAVKGVTNGL